MPFTDERGAKKISAFIGTRVKLAVSNIAWPPAELDRFLKILADEGCAGVEIAPSLLWPEPLSSTGEERKRVRRQIEAHGLRVTGFQALLYTRQDLSLFRDESAREEAFLYLVGLMNVCADLGGEVLVFGSPRNRSTRGLPQEDVSRIARDFFGRLAPAASKRGVTLCIEPLGASETDFINSTTEARKLLDGLGWPLGLGLHIDVKALIEARELGEPSLVDSFARARHAHVNDPELRAPGVTGFDHTPVARVIRESGYDRFLSIEMRRMEGNEEQTVRQAISYVKGVYAFS